MNSPAAPAAPPLRLGPPDPAVRRRFTRGSERPLALKWFGISSFWGHLRHFVASAIATEDVDSRDWMTPDLPHDLLSHIARELGGNETAPTLTQALERDLFVDFIADAGDDVAVSRAVARLLFAPYEVPDPEREGAYLLAPRGELLLFGGDTAYPVATAQEITNRVVVPFNQVLEALPPDPTPRVLLGIPGNHDWYDGLDGFARLFRRRDEDDDGGRPSVVGVSQIMLQHYAEWAREFVRGGKVEKPHALVLSGYKPLQNASYFALPVAPRLSLLAVDRQLRTPDSRQRLFLSRTYQDDPDAAIWLLLPDPVYRFGTASSSGTAMLETLRIDLEARDHFVLTGDVHHYQRVQHGRLLHVIAGGGGAFLHPSRIASGGLPAQRNWPGPEQCRRLLAQVPWKIARGRSGILPHLILLALLLVSIAFGLRFYDQLGAMLSAAALTTAVLGGVYALIGGARRRKSVLPFAFTAAAITALIPIPAAYVFGWTLVRLGVSAPAWILVGVTLAAALFTGTYIFGLYLALLTRLGFEHTQAFTALDHPGFKHFVRLRIRKDGSGIDGWCIGLVDPLGAGEKPVLVDQFQFRPRRSRSD